MRVNIIRKYIKGHKRSKNRPECGKQIQSPCGFCPPPSHYFQVAGYNIIITAALPISCKIFGMYLYDKMLYWFYDSNSFIPYNA
jgi:hypothetical protein